MEEILLLFVKLDSIRCHRQGSLPWLQERKDSVGCSELCNASNTKITKINIIKSKLGLVDSISNTIPIIWGNTFEDTTKLYTEFFMGCNILEVPGSIKRGNYGITCSPDGLGIIEIPLRYFLNICKKTVISDLAKKAGVPQFESMIDFELPQFVVDQRNDFLKLSVFVLFEFKSPISRTLCRSIPKEYIHQVLGGLGLLKEVDLGVYSECRFACCNFEQFGFNDGYLNIKNNDLTPDEFTFCTPKLIGCKFFIMTDHAKTYFDEYPIPRITYITSESDYRTFSSRLMYRVDFVIFDVAFCDHPAHDSQLLKKRFLESLPPQFDKEKYAKLYSLVSQNLSRGLDGRIKELTDEILKDDKAELVFAMQLWKLMDSQICFIRKIEDFLEYHRENVSDILQSARYLRRLDVDANKVLDDMKAARCKKSCILDELRAKYPY
jgi:hypothetical protein